VATTAVAGATSGGLIGKVVAPRAAPTVAATGLSPAPSPGLRLLNPPRAGIKAFAPRKGWLGEVVAWTGGGLPYTA
jgi:hypothetical protein